MSQQATNTNTATVKYPLWKPLSNNINFYNNILFAENGVDKIDVPSCYGGGFAGNLYYTSGTFNTMYNGNTCSSLESFRETGNKIFTGISLQVTKVNQCRQTRMSEAKLVLEINYLLKVLIN